MRSVRILITLILLLSALPAWAISFDIWETGISRQEMTSVAKEHDLPLARDGFFHRDKSFNPRLLAGEATCFYYNTTLLDHAARVRLHLSPQKGKYGQFLYEIEIMFSDVRKNRDLRPYLLKLLDDKYGPGSVKPDMIREIRVWHPEKDGEVQLTATPASLQLTYTDTRIKAIAEQLGKSTYDLPKKPLNHQDADRF
jgi:hypothetical protein